MIFLTREEGQERKEGKKEVSESDERSRAVYQEAAHRRQRNQHGLRAEQ